MNIISKQLLQIANIAEEFNEEENQQQKFDTTKQLKGDLSKIKSMGRKKLKALLDDDAYERLKSSNPSVEITPTTKLSQLTIDDLQKILACLV